MRCAFRISLFLFLAASAFAQTYTRANVASILGFENSTAGAAPEGWSISPARSVVADNAVVHSGSLSARLTRTASTASTYSSVAVAIPLDFAGRTIQLRGWFKLQNVSDFAALYAGEQDSSGAVVQFATLQSQKIAGDRDWARYSLTLAAEPSATRIYFGFLFSGTGTAWVDDLELLADGVPVRQAAERPGAILRTDREFDQGSRIALGDLSDVQVANLALLAKVWGFLKYHHPSITTGQRHWDYDLFRVMPQVLAAPDAAAGAAVLTSWVASLGPPPPCDPCAVLDASTLQLEPPLAWIADEAALGAGLSRALREIHRSRPAVDQQFFVSMLMLLGRLDEPAPSPGNPVFDNELSYPSLKFPDAGFQLLGLFRYWNIVQYFYPSRHIMSDDPGGEPDYWDKVLLAFLRPTATAPSAVAYQQQMLQFIGRIHDTHANLWSSLAARPPIGTCVLPVDVRFVEGKPIVLRATARSSVLQSGDLIESLDSVAIADLVDRWRPYYADSNEAARLRDIGNYMTRGTCGPVDVGVRRGDASMVLTADRLSPSLVDTSSTYVHHLPGDAFQILPGNVAYIKIGPMKSADAVSYLRRASATNGLIIDLRDYPSDFPLFALGDLLVSQPSPFCLFTHIDVATPGAIHWGNVVSLLPREPHYSGRIVILVDEITQSAAEYHAMAFRTVPGAIVLGSTTAGADGNVSTVVLPGALSSYISGLGTYYPDQRPAQRVGIVPDVWVTPTIEGIRAGRDELVEAAIRLITGEGVRQP